MKTITGREIKVKANNSGRTYTIRTESAKFRTGKMSKEEFESAYYWTANDWQHFLNSGDYSIVRKLNVIN